MTQSALDGSSGIGSGDPRDRRRPEIVSDAF